MFKNKVGRLTSGGIEGGKTTSYDSWIFVLFRCLC